MRRILQLPPPPPPSASPPASVTEGAAPTLAASTVASEEEEERAAARDVEEAISDYLRRATESFDLTKSVEVRPSCIHSSRNKSFIFGNWQGHKFDVEHSRKDTFFCPTSNFPRLYPQESITQRQKKSLTPSTYNCAISSPMKRHMLAAFPLLGFFNRDRT